MTAKTWIRRFLKLVTTLSFTGFVIGAAWVFLRGTENNPFVLDGSTDVNGPLNFLVFIVLAGLFLGSLGLLAVMNLVSWLTETSAEQAGNAQPTGQGEAGGSVPAEGRHLVSFRKSNFYVGVLLAVLLGGHAGMGLLADAVGPNGIVNLVRGVLAIGVAIFGGQAVLAVAVLGFLGIWYGLNRAATEAAVAGIGAWILVAFVGLGFVSSNASGVGLVIAGLSGSYYGFRAVSDTEPATAHGERFLDELRHAPTATRKATGSGDAQPDASGGAGGGPVADLRRTLAGRNLRSLEDIRAVVDLEPVFVHPRAADDTRLTYWSYLSYALGGLTILSALLVGIRLWGFPALGLWGLPVGALYLGHAFGLPQRSAFVHVGGLGWYAVAAFLALYTLSPLAFLANAGGLYLGWRATEGIRQPAELLAEFQEPSAESSHLGTGLLGSGIVGGVILGGIFGAIGAVVFAWISIETMTVYGLLLLLPALGAGIGVSAGVGEQGGTISGLIAAGVSVVSMGLGFRLISWWMPPRYQLEPDILLAVVPLLGIYLAFRVGTGLTAEASGQAGAESAGDGSGDDERGGTADSGAATD